MEDSPSAPAPETKPVRKRSTIERMIVWIGIVVLLLVLVVEWTSHKYYDETFKSLEATFNAPEKRGKGEKYQLAEVDKQIKGFAFRTEETVETKGLPFGGKEGVVKKQRRIVYTWPSLFKSYKLGVNLDEGGNADNLEVIIPGAS